MVGMSVAENLKKIESRIQNACARAGRDRSGVKLLAVSKLHGLEKIRAAYDCGLRDFAENYAQEAFRKQEQLYSLPVRWHFIGRIQSNKAKLLAGRFELIHSVDRPVIADIFNRQELNKPQDILLQFNVAGEASKGGAAEEDLRRTFADVTEHDNIRVMGLMVMPPLSEDAESVHPYFRRAREVLHELRSSLDHEAAGKHPMSELSMGTSQDFETAIEEGATWIRLGSEIFGPRPDVKPVTGEKEE